MRRSLSSARGRAALALGAASLAALLSLAAFGASDVRSGDRLSFALAGARVIAAPGRVSIGASWSCAAVSSRPWDRREWSPFRRTPASSTSGERSSTPLSSIRTFPRSAWPDENREVRPTRKSLPRSEPRLEALLPAIEGRIPVLVFADRLAQIRGALAWAKSEKLKIIIGGGRDAWRAASDLAAAGVPVLLDPVIGLPTRSDEPYDTPYAAPGILSKAGVRVAITEGDSQFARNLAHHASVAMAYGMPREKALEAITLEPARILGIADRVGSIEPGKNATLFVSDRDVLDFRYNVLAAYVDGRPLDLSDRHKRLYERYKNRPKPR